MNFAGLPAHTSLAGTSELTTEPAPTTHSAFRTVPAIIVALAPITTLFCTTIGFHLPPDGGYLSFVRWH